MSIPGGVAHPMKNIGPALWTYTFWFK